MNIYEHYTEEDIEEIAFGIGKVAHSFAARKTARINAITSKPAA